MVKYKTLKINSLFELLKKKSCYNRVSEGSIVPTMFEAIVLRFSVFGYMY